MFSKNHVPALRERILFVSSRLGLNQKTTCNLVQVVTSGDLSTEEVLSLPIYLALRAVELKVLFSYSEMFGGVRINPNLPMQILLSMLEDRGRQLKPVKLNNEEIKRKVGRDSVGRLAAQTAHHLFFPPVRLTQRIVDSLQIRVNVKPTGFKLSFVTSPSDMLQASYTSPALHLPMILDLLIDGVAPVLVRRHLSGDAVAVVLLQASSHNEVLIWDVVGGKVDPAVLDLQKVAAEIACSMSTSCGLAEFHKTTVALKRMLVDAASLVELE